MLVDPAHLRLLALIRVHGSLARAAAELGVTGAAVTGQVARAERDLDAPLVTRGPRGARLTEYGDVLADAGDRILAECATAGRALAALREPITRRLRIGAFQAAAQHLLPPALTALRHRHPGADLTVTELTSDRGPALIDAGAVDVAVIADYGDAPGLPPGVRSAPLLTDPMVLCLPDDHRLAPSGGLRLDQLAGDPWIVIVAGHAARDQFDRAATFTPRVQLQTENYNVAQALTATGIGVTMLSRLTVTPTPGAVHRPLLYPRLQRRLHVLTPETVLTPLTAPFLTLLTEVADDLTQAWAAAPL